MTVCMGPFLHKPANQGQHPVKHALHKPCSVQLLMLVVVSCRRGPAGRWPHQQHLISAVWFQQEAAQEADAVSTLATSYNMSSIAV